MESNSILDLVGEVPIRSECRQTCPKPCDVLISLTWK